MVPNLREAFASQTGPVVNLGNTTWQIAPNDTLKFKRSVKGDGAKILVPTAADRTIPALVARGTDQHFYGNVEMIGQRPAGTPYDKNKEGQHFIRMDGVAGGSVEGWTFRNGWADAISVDRNVDRVWSKNIKILDCVFEEMGRHHVTGNAVDYLTISGGTMGWSARSAVDIEPGGKADGARYFRWQNTTITAKGNAFPVFANGGVGSSTTVHHITLDGIKCPNRPFSVTVNPDPTDVNLRRSEYVLQHCSGKGTPNLPQLIFRKCDGVTLLDIDQPVMPGVKLALFDRCTRTSVA